MYRDQISCKFYSIKYTVSISNFFNYDRFYNLTTQNGHGQIYGSTHNHAKPDSGPIVYGAALSLK